MATLFDVYVARPGPDGLAGEWEPVLVEATREEAEIVADEYEVGGAAIVCLPPTGGDPDLFVDPDWRGGGDPDLYREGA